MRISSIILAGSLWLAGAVFARAAEKPAAKSAKTKVAKSTETVAPATEDEIKLVKFFIKTPTTSLPPEHIPRFVAIDERSLPKKLRQSFMIKREELLALKKIADGKKKGSIRRLSEEDQPPCGKPWEDPKAMWLLKQAGYGEIFADEEVRLTKDTKCSSCELEVEFSVKRIVVKKKPPQKDELHYMLHGKDPLWNLIAIYRAGRKNPFGTDFFGLGHPSCH